jgi:hypothetical protein
MSRCVTARSAGRRLLWPIWAVADGVSCRTGTACSGVGDDHPRPGPGRGDHCRPAARRWRDGDRREHRQAGHGADHRTPRGREAAQATARIEFTAAGTAERRQMPVCIGYALAMAAATGAPVRVAGQLTGQLAVAAQDDLAGRFTRNVRCRSRLAVDRLTQAGPVLGQAGRPGQLSLRSLQRRAPSWPSSRQVPLRRKWPFDSAWSL